MEELFYCCECQSLCNTTIIDKKQTLTIKGREITLMAPVRECTTCGEEILDEEMDIDGAIAPSKEGVKPCLRK